MGVQRKPLIINDSGDFQNLPDGDYLKEANLPTTLNGNASSVVKGTPLYHTSTSDSVDKCFANGSGAMPCCGLAVTTATTGTSIIYQDSGPLTLTTAEWDAVTGQTGGLTIGAWYYVDNVTAGKLESTAPTTGASQKIGQATKTDTLHIMLKPVIYL